MTEVVFIVPIRNKEAHVGKCVRSILGQTYTNFTAYLSDQGSEDNSKQVVRELVDAYSGPINVKLLDCPHTEYRSMCGLNVHFNWLHEQIDADLIIMCSADDWNEPRRVEKTVAAFEAFNPSYVSTGVRYETPAGEHKGETGFPNKRSRFVEPGEAIKHQITSSGSSAWAGDLWKKYGPLTGYESQDIILPVLALFDRGIYYVDEILHHHVFHADGANTGMEGQMRGAKDEEHLTQLIELNNMHHMYNWVHVYRRLLKHGLYNKLDAEAHAALNEKFMNAAGLWVDARETLTMSRIRPLGMAA